MARGAAIECRIYAEDPDRGFLPSPGTVTAVDLPEGPGLRHECGVEPGSVVSVHYDPLLTKLIAAGRDRAEALERLADGPRALPDRGGEDHACPSTGGSWRARRSGPGAVHTRIVEGGLSDHG